jgi:tetratricopeptide (TPR) repeat protein
MSSDRRSRSTLDALWAGAFLVGFLASGGPAFASDPRTEKAREHYLQGDAYYKLDKYPSALAEYEQAYLAKPDPSVLYNIAQCHRLMGNRTEAVRFYRRYLKDAPNAPNREVADKHIKDLEAALASPDPPPRPVGAPPLSPTPAASSSPAPAQGFGFPPPATGANAGNPQTLAMAPPPPATGDSVLVGNPPGAVPPSSDESHPIYTRWWFWTGVGAVVAGGILILLLANRDPACPSGRTCQ